MLSCCQLFYLADQLIHRLQSVLGLCTFVILTDYNICCSAPSILLRVKRVHGLECTEPLKCTRSTKLGSFSAMHYLIRQAYEAVDGHISGLMNGHIQRAM